MEKIELRNENGIHFAYFKGVKLPCLIRTTIDQAVGMITTAILEFEVDLEKNNRIIEIKGSDLINILVRNPSQSI